MTCLVLAPPIFPGRRQPSIVGRNELNYRVRNGNGWTLVLISTNFIGAKTLGHRSVYRPGKTRTMNSSYDALFTCQVLPLVKECGDPYRIRTDVNGVRGRCLNHLTNGPGRRKLRSTRSRHKPSAFVESSLRSVAPPLPRQTLRWFASDPHGGRWTKGRGLCGGSCLRGSSEPGVSPGYTQLRTGAPSRTRTGDPLIKSQLLYQLS